MRHVFIINPAAGKRDCTAQLLEMAKGLEARHGLTVERILTRRPPPWPARGRTCAFTPAAATAPSARWPTPWPGWRAPP